MTVAIKRERKVEPDVVMRIEKAGEQVKKLLMEHCKNNQNTDYALDVIWLKSGRIKIRRRVEDII